MAQPYEYYQNKFGMSQPDYQVLAASGKLPPMTEPDAAATPNPSPTSSYSVNPQLTSLFANQSTGPTPGRDDAWYLRNGIAPSDLTAYKSMNGGSGPALAGQASTGIAAKGNGVVYGDPSKAIPNWEVLGLGSDGDGNLRFEGQDQSKELDNGKFWRQGAFTKAILAGLAAYGGAAYAGGSAGTGGAGALGGTGATVAGTAEGGLDLSGIGSGFASGMGAGAGGGLGAGVDSAIAAGAGAGAGTELATSGPSTFNPDEMPTFNEEGIQQSADNLANENFAANNADLINSNGDMLANAGYGSTGQEFLKKAAASLLKSQLSGSGGSASGGSAGSGYSLPPSYGGGSGYGGGISQASNIIQPVTNATPMQIGTAAQPTFNFTPFQTLSKGVEDQGSKDLQQRIAASLLKQG